MLATTSGPPGDVSSGRRRWECAGEKSWPWRAVDQQGIVLAEILRKRRDKRAAKRLLKALTK
ncbi:DDE-type integrase/transposase/recombinase, partial [Rhizobium ruizarguesonis]